MATFRKTGIIHTFRQKLVEGMVARGYARAFAERCFNQIEGFGEYGFPESHAASFALLVYVSAWLKCHYPAAFAAALINSQPMGFYAPAQIVRDARAHGTDVRPPDVNASDWDCTLEADGPSAGGVALRLGLRQIKGFKEEDAARLVAARGPGFASVRALWRRAGLSAAALTRLAEADAFGSLGLTRRDALWAVRGLGPPPLPLFAAAESREPAVALPVAGLGEEVADDYRSLHLSLKAHPLSLLRDELDRRRTVTAARLAEVPAGRRVRVAGLVLVRQRPGTAKGVIFATLEDETGVANVIVWPGVFERFRRTVLAARLLCVDGEVQREGIVLHVVAHRLEDWSALLARLTEADKPLAPALARADHVKRPERDARTLPLRSRDFH